MAYYIAKSYNQYTLLLNSYKAVSMPLNLTPIDVYSLTFDKLYFFSQLGRYYFLDSIRYSPGTIAEGNFVEVPEFATNAAPESIGVYNLTIGFSSSRSVSLQDITGSFYDPEFDAPAKVKIVSGFNSELLIYQNGTLLTGETEINAQDLNYHLPTRAQVRTKETILLHSILRTPVRAYMRNKTERSILT
ncbi:hypothetical protein SAMN05192545_0019 [Maribacter dokdonensis]|uniref:Uncharacterized protein n=1 Tax=Maribacter dokdonensis TaxID=320912 RepID=A0ABY0TXW4_9FLAO|nr:hypothetical protein [Maribacter dokdonensis]SDR74536.1 hypothetical protein SAMN05192545_0019 [Maribacter dokdonensis]